MSLFEFARQRTGTLVTAPPIALAPLIIGVTSHRNIAESETAMLRERVRFLFEQLKKDFPELPLVVLSALAEGGDQLVAREALNAGARLVAPLPIEPDAYQRDFSDEVSRCEFSALCARASVLQLPLLERNTAEGVAEPGAQRDAQYAEAGVYIASHSHILLAIWDGRCSDLLGGTAQIVRYYLEGILPGSIERRSGMRPLVDRGDESLLYHIACSRTDPDGKLKAPDPPLRPLHARWLSQSRACAAAEGIPDDFRLIFRRMVQFNTDSQRYCEEVVAAARNPADGSNAVEGEEIETLFAAADRLAIHFQKRVLLAMRGIHALAALMGIAFVCYSDLPGDWFDQGDMIYVFIALFAAGVILDRLAKRREWHRKYIDYRALAEGLRVQHYWFRAGVSAAGSIAFAHDNFMQKQDVELGWIRNVMRAAGINAPDRIRVEERVLADVIDEWIGAANRGGQLGYYAHRTQLRMHVHQTARMLGMACLWTGIAIALVLAAFQSRLEADVTTSMIALIGVLAIVAAARESYSYRKADKELIKQYVFMRNIFNGARNALEAEQDSNAQREILRALGEAALAEHAEWALTHRERPLEHGKL
ncbi:MAG TPA: hypothetical protein VFN25_11280 [Dokdonella sp.]|uniref:hypothetical protein n=1 Tax=Dokdonella sp. TaxID=2291710 RepID=UPI002D80524B|nr:hypothetical protein [Dokdonella sp.]HET9033475.1 hypothetical protein [Dokdonella sp.]